MQKSLPEQRYEIRFSGSGGQGIILASVMLAEAAVLEGRHVAQSQEYGPETRGGTSSADVIVSDAEIDYPRAIKLDILVALTNEGIAGNILNMKADGLIIIDPDLTGTAQWGRVASLPLRQIARKAGEERAINIAALGAVVAFCPILSRKFLTQVIVKKFPGEKAKVNLAAFDQALKFAKKLKVATTARAVEDSFSI